MTQNTPKLQIKHAFYLLKNLLKQTPLMKEAMVNYKNITKMLWIGLMWIASLDVDLATTKY